MTRLVWLCGRLALLSPDGLLCVVPNRDRLGMTVLCLPAAWCVSRYGD